MRSVRRYGDFDAGGVSPGWVDRLFGKRSMGWRAWSADVMGSTGVARRRLIDEAVVQSGATASVVMAGRKSAKQKCSTGMSPRT